MRSQEDNNEENERKRGKMKNEAKGCKERVKMNNGKRRRKEGNKKHYKEQEQQQGEEKEGKGSMV